MNTHQHTWLAANCNPVNACVRCTAEINDLAGLNDEQGRQLRITVASLRQQLGFERQQRTRTSKEIAELRSHSSTSSRAGQALQQQVRIPTSVMASLTPCEQL